MEVNMNKLCMLTCSLGILLSASACVGNTQNPLDSFVNSTKNTFIAMTGSASSGINYAEPQGFTASVNGDDYFLTIYNGRVHTLFYIGDAEPALLFKITKSDAGSFTAECVADVSFDKWNSKHPSGTISGKMSGDDLVITFSNDNMDVTGYNLKSLTLKKVRDDVTGFVQSKKNIFDKKI